jgi:hypothetical protein
MLQFAECVAGKGYRITREAKYRDTRWPHVYAASDEATKACRRDGRGPSFIGSLQYRRGSTQVRGRAGRDTNIMLTDMQIQETRLMVLGLASVGSYE